MADVLFPALSFLTFWAVATATGVIAVLIFVADPRRNWNRWLSLFLALVSANFALQTWGSVGAVQVAHGELTEADHQSAQRVRDAIGFTLQIFDGAVLAYFASIFPRRSGLAARRWLLIPLGLLMAFFVWVEWNGHHLTAGKPTEYYRLAFFLFYAAALLYSAWRIFRNFLQERSSIMARQLRIVTFGFMVAILSRIALVANDLEGYWSALVPLASEIMDGGLRLAVLWSLYVAFFLFMARRAPEPSRRQDAASVGRVVAVFFGILSLVWTVDRGRLALFGETGITNPFARGLFDYVRGALPFTIRWFVFAGAMFYGIIRFQILAVDPRRVAAGGLAAATLASFFGIGLSASGAGPWAAAGVGAACLFLVGAGVYFAIVRESRLRPAGFLDRRRLEAYQSVVATAIAQGVMTPGRRRDLEDARRRLNVSASEHETILAIAQAEESTPHAREVVLGRYEVLRPLGAGGYSTIHLARDAQTGGIVVLKRIQERWVGAKTALDAAIRELEVARRVSHPNLIAIHDVVRLENEALVVMEYAAEGSARDLLNRTATLPGPEVARILDQSLAGLEALHEAGIVHSDLKPENVLLATGGRVRLADFGAARGFATARTLAGGAVEGAALGTLLYMSPEQARGQPATPRSDLYSLGAIAYEALTGQSYVDSGGLGPLDLLRRIAEGPKVRPSPTLSSEWVAFLENALASDPKRRFSDARAMRFQLERLLILVGSEARAPPMAGRSALFRAAVEPEKATKGGTTHGRARGERRRGHAGATR